MCWALVPQNNGEAEVAPGLSLGIFKDESIFPIQIESISKSNCEW
jgi:hypothetical protein